jgi:NADH-quinone oxidoreductase subunit J
MMLDINVERVSGGYARYLPLGIGVAGLMVVELGLIIWRYSTDFVTSSGFAATPEGYSNTEALGAILYTEHVYAFEIAAVILLLAIIAAISLTMRRRPGLKQQDIAKQVAVRAKDRVRIVKMAAESPDGEGQS